MPFYYLSFCDPAKPTGTQFLGATVVEAGDPSDMLTKTHLNGTNPGGEVEFLELDFETVDDLPETARSYLNRFVPREEVMAGRYMTTAELLSDDERVGGDKITGHSCDNCDSEWAADAPEQHAPDCLAAIPNS